MERREPKQGAQERCDAQDGVELTVLEGTQIDVGPQDLRGREERICDREDDRENRPPTAVPTTRGEGSEIDSESFQTGSIPWQERVHEEHETGDQDHAVCAARCLELVLHLAP